MRAFSGRLYQDSSKADSWQKVKDTIDRYEAYGADYALAINPLTRQTYERGLVPAELGLNIDAIIDA